MGRYVLVLKMIEIGWMKPIKTSSMRRWRMLNTIIVSLLVRRPRLYRKSFRQEATKVTDTVTEREEYKGEKVGNSQWSISFGVFEWSLEIPF